MCSITHFVLLFTSGFSYANHEQSGYYSSDRRCYRHIWRSGVSHSKVWKRFRLYQKTTGRVFRSLFYMTSHDIHSSSPEFPVFSLTRKLILIGRHDIDVLFTEWKCKTFGWQLFLSMVSMYSYDIQVRI